MDVLIDTDALVKATKAGLKRTFCAHFTLHVVPTVEAEAVDEGEKQGLPDAVEPRVAREHLLALRPYVSEASYRLASEDPRIRESGR